MREKIGRRSAVAATSLALASALAAPPAPAGATTAESCHPPGEIPVKCVCEQVVKFVSDLIPLETWNCP